MRILDACVLVAGITIAIGWSIISSRDGFESGNALIVARSISVASTIDGSIVTPQPAVGARVAANDLLVKIQNGRIDRGRWAELLSQVNFLQSEIANAKAERSRLQGLLAGFKKRIDEYSRWLTKDLQLQKKVKLSELNAATEKSKIDAQEIERTRALFKKAVRSEANLETARTRAEITRNQAEASKAELARIELLANAVSNSGMLLEGGEASYWSKMADSIQLRLLDNEKLIATLQAQLVRTRAQATVEDERINSSFTEEHRATVDGVVNAVFFGKGSRVVAGTPLLQVLDCTRPVIIVPLPEHRIGEFSIGQKVTVYPADSEQVLEGKIQYISSGPLLGKDKTIAVEQDITLSGNKAIVGFEPGNRIGNASDSCDSTRMAVAVIHTKSLFQRIFHYVDRHFGIVQKGYANARPANVQVDQPGQVTSRHALR